MSDNISIHALREEGDSAASCSDVKIHYFYPRPPRGGRHCLYYTPIECKNISIHALREEGDVDRPEPSGNDFLFLSTPSARRATHQI